ncbi:hypothetical protein NP233_g9438 [Leucocoprinus birnbaumii]|uniref:Uncharacterized protein n=1 Tax=Leucocoprinus birnbaumii TaxID=56174 RepID=A0AAD5VNW2_9AGAR|nr:hypothetical protein NP233_g9438 [Leucocoprinus birnbaumii]
MAKKTRTKVKDDDKLARGGGNKAVKVVTFDTPKKGSSEQPQHADDWDMDNNSAVSGSAAWGESAGDGAWNNPSSGWAHPSEVGLSSPSPQPLPVPPPVPPEAHSPPPTSPRPPRPPSASPDPSTSKMLQMLMNGSDHLLAMLRHTSHHLLHRPTPLSLSIPRP